jgi:hypothetical protein
LAGKLAYVALIISISNAINELLVNKVPRSYYKRKPIENSFTKCGIFYRFCNASLPVMPCAGKCTALLNEQLFVQDWWPAGESLQNRTGINCCINGRQWPAG